MSSAPRSSSSRSLAFKEHKGHQFQQMLNDEISERLKIPKINIDNEIATHSRTNRPFPGRDNGNSRKRIHDEYFSDTVELTKVEEMKSCPTQFCEARNMANRLNNLLHFRPRPVCDSLLSSSLLFPDEESKPVPLTTVSEKFVKILHRPEHACESPAYLGCETDDTEFRPTTPEPTPILSPCEVLFNKDVDVRRASLAYESKRPVEMKVMVAELRDSMPLEELTHFERTLLNANRRRTLLFQRRRAMRKIRKTIASYPDNDDVDPAFRILSTTPFRLENYGLHHYRINSRMKSSLFLLPNKHPCGEIIT